MKYCLIGEKLSHSYSKEIHTYFGLEYNLEEIKRERLENFLRNSSYDGFNVTIPYKTTVIPFLDEISKEALSIGAVNTILKKNGKLYGYNTDINGMKTSIRRIGETLKDKTVLVLGTGGASKTAVYLSKEEGAKEVIIVSRVGEVNYNSIYDEFYTSRVNVIINTTPVGMYPNTDNTPIDITKFPHLALVFDIVYNPINTILTQNAREVGIKTASGLYMLTSQAIKAEEIWGKNSYDSSKLDEAYSYLLKEKTNIVIEGMPGSGKTTIGQLLSKKFNRNFYDIDKEFEKLTKTTPSAFIKSNGEEAFRKVEKEIVSSVSKSNKVVIALGGGSVLIEENRYNLKKNGIVIYIKRSLEKLTSDNRPLSQQKGISTIYKERAKIYEDFADFTVSNNSTIDECINKIESYFNKI